MMSHSYRLSFGLWGWLFILFVLISAGAALPAGDAPAASAPAVREEIAGAFGAWSVIQTAEITLPEGNAQDRFGACVAMSGDVLAVGAPFHDPGGRGGQGAVFLYVRKTDADGAWTLIQRLTDAEGKPGDAFGAAVAMSGELLAVGAPHSRSGKGSVALYGRNRGGSNNWGLVSVFSPADDSEHGFLGTSLALGGGTLVVGAPSGHGAVFVYERPGSSEDWKEADVLTASGGPVVDEFGAAVALDGDTLVVGAPLRIEGNRPVQGSIHIFSREAGKNDSWREMRKIPAVGGQGRFGDSVSLHQGTAAVGTGVPDRSEIGERQDPVRIFAQDSGGEGQWGEVRMLAAPDSAKESLFGVSILVAGNTLLVGARGGATRGGYVTAYRRHHGGMENWGEAGKLVPSDGAPGDAFGSSLALVGDTIVVGASGKRVAGNPNQGAVYVFQDRSLRAEDDAYTIPMNQSRTIEAPGVLKNDAAGEGASAVQDTEPAHGSLNFHGDGSFTYTPARDNVGRDSFIYHIAAAGGVSDPAVVSFATTSGADLEVQKTFLPAQLCPPRILTYTLDVLNHGPDAATNVQLHDNLPVQVSLSLVDQTDDDNSAAGFGGGSNANTVWNSGNSWLQLSNASLPGTFTSRFLDAGRAAAWSTLDWLTHRPVYKELPDSAATESGYDTGNATMTGNVLLMHMDSAGAHNGDTVSDTSGSGNSGTLSTGDADDHAAAGRFKYALNFDGADDYVNVPHSGSLNISGSITIEAWVKGSSTSLYGNGSNGALYVPSGTTTLDTTSYPNGFNYTTVTVNSGATLTATGANPLIIRSQGDCNIYGALDVSGTAGGDNISSYFGYGGEGKLGGYGGGNGGPGGPQERPGAQSGVPRIGALRLSAR